MSRVSQVSLPDDASLPSPTRSVHKPKRARSGVRVHLEKFEVMLQARSEVSYLRRHKFGLSGTSRDALRKGPMLVDGSSRRVAKGTYASDVSYIRRVDVDVDSLQLKLGPQVVSVPRRVQHVSRLVQSALKHAVLDSVPDLVRFDHDVDDRFV